MHKKTLPEDRVLLEPLTSLKIKFNVVFFIHIKDVITFD